MKTELKATASKELYFQNIAAQFNGILSKELGEYLIKINTDQLHGTVRGIEVNENKFYLEFDITTNAFVTIPLLEAALQPLHFLYCQTGQFMYSVEQSEEPCLISEFQTAIGYHESHETILRFAPETHTKLTVITVCPPSNSGDDSTMAGTIFNYFSEKIENGFLMYVGSYNLKIMDEIERLQNINGEFIVRKLLLEGIVQLILAHEIRHHQDDIDTENECHRSLRKEELKTIHDLGNEIRENWDQPYCIDGLTEQTGISAAKLQEGFKHLFGRTINDYIKNVRLEIAEGLIANNELTISEVVYSVGFSSRSYFSKIFKEKYNCSPKYYQESKRQKMSA